MNKISQPQDKLAKEYLTNIEIGKDFLTIYLEKELLQKCDLSTLKIVPNTFITDDIKSLYADVIYKVKLKDNKGVMYAYVLIEHQSTLDDLMPLRILKYQVAILENFVKENGKNCCLPLVPAFVYYSGKVRSYPYKTSINELFCKKRVTSTCIAWKFWFNTNR